MKNKFTDKILLSALTISFLTIPTHASESYHGLRNSINAGFRLSIPFGPTKQSEDKIKYGLQMSFRRELNNSYNFSNDGHMSVPQIYNADILSLDFSENGFKGLSLAGRETFIYQDGIFKAAESTEENGGMSGLTLGLIIGAGVITVGISAFFITVCAKNRCDGS
ncbi:hypothetical protein MNBD_ALPHA01-128 [hydrothermal vent metagenome]|uniref:Uncharacterized protein n=1 Tax=hydrothermal vent metagenome TaxID=652676 RepID=A0A3B0SK34_9ZZZZ